MSWALLPICADKRKEILAEIRDDINSRAKESGVSGVEAEEKFIHTLEKPSSLARRYIEIYGISHLFLAILSGIGIILSIISVPLLPLPTGIYVYPESLAALTVLLITVYVAWAFIRFPKKGWVVAISAGFSRIAIFLVYYFWFGILFEFVDTLLFLLTTVGIVVVGYLVLYFSMEGRTNA